MSNFYALLIGINYYYPNIFSNDIFNSLRGCLRDIALIEELLITKFQVPENNIFKLISPKDTKNKLSKSPTYENIVQAFLSLIDIAQSQDLVYIYYSGHGARPSTKFPDLKGQKAKDESLVPCDINLPKARYLRDVELAYLIQKMVEKKLTVTLVIDSCHSGGITRGQGSSIIRSTNRDDSTPRIMKSLVATEEELAQTWRSLSSTFTGNYQDGISWLPDPKGYILLAACSPHEAAYEEKFENDEFNGLLTYYLVKIFNKIDLNLATYDLVYRNILPHLSSKQTPLLLGDGSRFVLGDKTLELEPISTIKVTKVSHKTEKVWLDIGQAQGVRKNAELAIYPSTVVDFADASQRLALVQLEEVGATNSRASIKNIFQNTRIEIGAQGILLDPGNIHLRSNICLVYNNRINSTANHKEALERVREALKNSENRFVILSDSEKFDYQVAVNSEGAYEIWDTTGNLIKQQSQIMINSDNAAMKIIQRLVHITKYYNVLHLENFNFSSPLKGNLQVEIFKAPPDWESYNIPKPQSFKNPNSPTIKAGEFIYLYVKNNSSQVLWFSILGLMSDWSIELLYPSVENNFQSLESNSDLFIPIESYLPEGYVEGADTFKVFGTLEPTLFRWLTLPSLDKLSDFKDIGFRQTHKPKTSLEEFLSFMTADNLENLELDFRNGRLKTASLEWITEQRYIKLKKSDI